MPNKELPIVDSVEPAYSDKEAARRRDEALRRALNTLPPIKPTVKPKGVKPASDQRQDQNVPE